MEAPSWVQALTDLNLVAILDVALDLRDAGQLTKPSSLTFSSCDFLWP